MCQSKNCNYSETCVLADQKSCLIETILLSTHNTCFGHVFWINNETSHCIRGFFSVSLTYVWLRNKKLYI